MTTTEHPDKPKRPLCFLCLDPISDEAEGQRARRDAEILPARTALEAEARRLGGGTRRAPSCRKPGTWAGLRGVPADPLERVRHAEHLSQR